MGQNQVNASGAHNDTLSPTMQFAVELAAKNGGSLRYHSGGYWAGDDFVSGGNRSNMVSVGRLTVDALIARGVMAFTEWSPRRYPMRASLLQPPSSGERQP
jgi:hypothetical protein